MATSKPHMVASAYETAPSQTHLDDRIRDLTAQLEEARAEAANHEQSRSLLDLQQDQPPVYEESTQGDSSYAIAAEGPNNSRQPAPSASPRTRIPDAPPPPYTTDRIPLPIVLPQTSKNFRGAFYSPFVRAYVPELEAHDISQSDFLTFIDGLNEAFVANPVFEGFGIAGAIMQQFYGLHPVQWAGTGVSVVSGAASAATSYARTRAYVKAVTANLFHPVGLHVDILTTKKMMAKVGHPEERLSLPPLDTTDQLEGSVLRREASSNSSQILNEDARMRRIRALQGYVMPLDFDVPEAVTPDNVLKRMGNAQAKRQARKQQKKDDKRLEKALEKRDEKLHEADKKIAEVEKELSKERRKMEKKMGKKKAMSDPKERAKIEKDFGKKERELSRDMEKALAKREKKVEKHGERDGDAAALPKLVKREEKTANKIRWVVITTWNGDEDEEVASEDSGSLNEDVQQETRS